MTNSNLTCEFIDAPFRSGFHAGTCADWASRLWRLAEIHPEHVFWTRTATAAARLFLPYYEKAYRGDGRPRAAIVAAETLLDNTSRWAREDAAPLREQVSAIRRDNGLAGFAVQMAEWAIQTALATHSAQRGALSTRGVGHSPAIPQDQTDWVECAWAALTAAANAMRLVIRLERKGWPPKWRVANDEGKQRVCTLLRDLLGPGEQATNFSPEWRTSTAVALASQMYESREFSAMPILADALQDAGCDNEDILSHCRGVGPHSRGCWVLLQVLDKE